MLFFALVFRVDELTNQIERMMEWSFDPSGGEDKSDKPNGRGLGSAHHTKNFEKFISSRVDGFEQQLIETSHTLQKILEIVSSSAERRVRSFFSYFAFLQHNFGISNNFFVQVPYISYQLSNHQTKYNL